MSWLSSLFKQPKAPSATDIAQAQTITSKAQSKVMQEYAKSMIPVQAKQAEMELGIQSLAFAQQIEQAESLYLLARRFEDQGQQPVFVPRSPAAKPPSAAQTSNYMLYIGLAVLAWYLWKGI